MNKLLITIDGPSGAGKTTVSRMLAQRLGYAYVDTGALYRGIAVMVQRAGIPADDDQAIASLCQGIQLSFSPAPDGGMRLFANSQDITDALRTPDITMLASALSARPVVRQCLLSIQRDLGKDKGAVFEGRDMGTVVFPQADIKFFLDADASVRARRRFEENLARNTGETLEQVKAALIKRDLDDSSRSLAPLKPAQDALRIECSSLSAQQVVECMLSRIHEKRK